MYMYIYMYGRESSNTDSLPYMYMYMYGRESSNTDSLMYGLVILFCFCFFLLVHVLKELY